ncbi:MAG: hypothetical protein V3W31_09030 [Thermodesulfobacteriota bacterium]
MKDNGVKAVVDMIRGAKIHELLLVSFVVMPVVFSAWAYVLEKFRVFDKMDETYLFVLLVLAYIVSIFIMKITESKFERLRRDADLVIKEIRSRKNFTRLRFVTIRSKFGNKFNEMYLRELIEIFPDELEESEVVLRGKEVTRWPGIKVVAENNG